MKRLVIVIAVLALLSFGAIAQARVAQSWVELIPSLSDVAPGSTVDVSVVLHAASPINMMAMSEILFYDPAVFTYVDPSVVQGASLTPTWDFLAGVPNAGELRIASFSGGFAAEGTLFSFTLRANAGAPLGSSAVTWGDGSFLGNGFGYGDAEFNDVLLPSFGTSINVQAVPEPGSIVAALALLGPAGMMFRRRKA